MKQAGAVREAARAVREADALIVAAGAGMGVDSGLPDFRGREGFWKAYPPIARLGISFAEMANPRWFESDPKLAWAFYGHRLNLYRRTVPHDGFRMLRDIAGEKAGGCFVFTSNVDGHFRKAGFSGDWIEECHGSIHFLQCVAPCDSDVWSADAVRVDVDEEKFEAADPLPTCGRCGGIARPNILMFGDWNWVPDRSAAQEAARTRWFRELKSEGRRPAIIEIGAGLSVPTVRHFSERAARELDGTLIRINPRDPDVPRGGISLPMGGKEGIEAISELMRG